MKPGFTFEELQDAWSAIMGLEGVEDDDDPSYLSIGQAADRWGMGYQAAQMRLQRAVKAGLAEERRVMRPCADGRRRVMTVYRPSAAKEGK